MIKSNLSPRTFFLSKVHGMISSLSSILTIYHPNVEIKDSTVLLVSPSLDALEFFNKKIK